MKVLVTGAAGMLGHALMSQTQPHQEVVGATRKDADLCDAQAVNGLLKAHHPAVVVHAAAYTDVDGCETDPQRAWQNNAQATLHVAQACKDVEAIMVFISTDYVFDGSKVKPYVEEDVTNPINVYGQTKLRGEQYVQQTLDRYLIIRTSWVYGPYGKNFVDTIRRAATERSELRVVNDQRGSPTYTMHLAATIGRLVARGQRGLFHVTGSGECTWFEFSRAIMELSAPGRVRVLPVPSSEFPRPARRPANSVLDTSRLAHAGFDQLPTWQDALAEYLGIAGLPVGQMPLAQKRL